MSERHRDPRIPPPRRVEQPAHIAPKRTGRVIGRLMNRGGGVSAVFVDELDFNVWLTTDALAILVLQGWVWP